MLNRREFILIAGSGMVATLLAPMSLNAQTTRNNRKEVEDGLCSKGLLKTFRYGGI